MYDLILKVVGINHVTAPVEVREKIVFTKEQLGDGLAALAGHVHQGLILSTCNRTEVYGVVPDSLKRGKDLLLLVAQQRGLNDETITPYCYVYTHRQAIRHLLRVTSGLDSMVVGEEQIQTQVRHAIVATEKAGWGGRPISNLFRQAIRVGKRARSETGISRYPVSVSHAAVKLAKEICGDLRPCSLLVVSAGEMGKLTANIVRDSGIGQIRITSRTYRRALNLARALGGTAWPWESLAQAIADSDVVISSTGSPGFIIGKEIMKEAMTKRQGRPLLIIDIAVPRDVDPAVRTVGGVHLRDIDDLSVVTQGALAERKKEASKVEGIIEEEVDHLARWWTSQKAVPTIIALREKAEAIRHQELNKTLARIPRLTEEEKEKIEALTGAIVKKMLHSPISHMKNGVGQDASLALVEELFDLGKEG